ncbi:MAG: response regulator [Gammaproteobacteria bacterium]|nr:response regulator [Gammaproteobacteria bacterium]MCW8983086.1 response regulator [Gammaproteobacteria bacterium]
MPIPVVICDDSSFARKQVARALPNGWDITLSFASNGREGIEAIREGKGDILFLDLQMPDMDGFEVLETIRRKNLQTLPIVISGDIQEESQKRVKSLGAVAFVKKPVDAPELSAILDSYGVLSILETPMEEVREDSVTFEDWIQEIANIAMGRAADLLAQFIDESIELSIPKVRLLEPVELDMMLASSSKRGISHVSQGFIGSGVFGETLIIFHDINFSELSKLMNYSQELDGNGEMELLMGLSNILSGSFLKEIAELLTVNFSFGHPRISSSSLGYDELEHREIDPSEKVLSIHINYAIGKNKVECEQLILFPQEALSALRSKASYILEKR